MDFIPIRNNDDDTTLSCLNHLLQSVVCVLFFCRQRKQYVENYLPWALKTGKSIKPLLTIYWEQRWTQNIDELREEIGIVPLV